MGFRADFPAYLAVKAIGSIIAVIGCEKNLFNPIPATSSFHLFHQARPNPTMPLVLHDAQLMNIEHCPCPMQTPQPISMGKAKDILPFHCSK